jgi:biotin carboxylase
MLRALGELRIDGVPTNIDEQKALISSPEFRSGNFDVSFYEKFNAKRKVK